MKKDRDEIDGIFKAFFGLMGIMMILQFIFYAALAGTAMWLFVKFVL